MKFLAVLFLGILAAIQVAAKTLVVSDIDDTIKISHVLDTSESIKNALKTGNVFADMNLVYQGIKTLDKDVQFYYVSNAIRAFMQKSHQKFLVQNNFPEGTLSLRPSLSEKNFKLEEIRKIIADEKPDRVVFFGDNGERDPKIYAQLVKEHPKVRFVTYIHVDYFTKSSEDKGATLQPGQIGYVTAWDLLLQLRQVGLVSDSYTRGFLKAFADFFLLESGYQKDGKLVIPAWVDCRDFVWTAKDEDLAGVQDHRLVKERTLDRCSQEAIED